MSSEITASDYFALDPRTVSSETGRWFEIEKDVPLLELTKGLTFHPVVGKNLLVNFVRYEPYTEAPRHWHPEEQMTFVLEGQFEFEVGVEKRIVRPGQVVWIPSNVPHAARTSSSTCYQVDVFNPPRQGLILALKQVRKK